MSDQFVSSDSALLDVLRVSDSMTVGELAQSLSVTATAVRQRLSRLMAQGLVQRSATKPARGRPSHQYALTSAGRRKTGMNFIDLAFALWDEIRSIQDVQIRQGVLGRIAGRLAGCYSNQIDGETLDERMQSVVDLFGNRQIPLTVERDGGLPVLTALACPYPDLAEQDRGICAMERMMFSELLGENVQLSKCRLDGENCCTFHPNEPATTGKT